MIQVHQAAQSIVTQPPEHKAKPKKATITTLSSGFALLLVFVRKALCNGVKGEETTGKLAQIKASWLLALGGSERGRVEPDLGLAG